MQNVPKDLLLESRHTGPCWIPTVPVRLCPTQWKELTETHHTFPGSSRTYGNPLYSLRQRPFERSHPVVPIPFLLYTGSDVAPGAFGSLLVRSPGLGSRDDTGTVSFPVVLRLSRSYWRTVCLVLLQTQISVSEVGLRRSPLSFPSCTREL